MTDTITMRVVKTPRGWAVAAGRPYYLTETRTKREAVAWIDRAARGRRGLAEAEHGQAARLAGDLAERGIGAIDYRQLKPGDLFTWARPDGWIPPAREVIRVDHASGGSLIYYADTPGGFILCTPGTQFYGRIQTT